MSDSDCDFCEQLDCDSPASIFDLSSDEFMSHLINTDRAIMQVWGPFSPKDSPSPTKRPGAYMWTDEVPALDSANQLHSYQQSHSDCTEWRKESPTVNNKSRQQQTEATSKEPAGVPVVYKYLKRGMLMLNDTIADTTHSTAVVIKRYRPT
jgi:hypothetical protein